VAGQLPEPGLGPAPLSVVKRPLRLPAVAPCQAASTAGLGTAPLALGKRALRLNPEVAQLLAGLGPSALLSAG
jgi:hypothetical protein